MQRSGIVVLVDITRTRVEDKLFDTDLDREVYENHILVRVAAKNAKFHSVDFKYSVFEYCYFNACRFEFCDFTGCRFLGTNFSNTTFYGCNFDYSTFEKTLIAPDILDSECPDRENVKVRFARSLRVNFQQLGDAKAVNKAISVELSATETHLYKSWRSGESYYRRKYQGLARFRSFVDWLSFKLLDVLWGNGESIRKLLRTICWIFVSIAILDAVRSHDQRLVSSYFRGAIESPQIFLGTRVPIGFSHSVLTGILVLRLVVFGALVGLITKRYSRR